MSKNILQVYTDNPITTNQNTDLMYFGRSPYGTGDDTAMLFSNFAAQFGAPYTPSALTKVDDTNVTLTLGGTPATALLEAVSLTLGWTGLLSPARGGTGVNNGTNTLTLAGNLATIGAFASNFTMTGATNVTFPTSGTLATTSQIPSVTPSALTRVDDTNVTVTLGGTPATSLLQAVSLTMGWTGQLSPARGGTGVNNGTNTLTLGGTLQTSGAFNSVFTMTGATNVTFPTSGTLATTTQLPTPAALTKTDDTNVTLTLGGTPATALLQATSLTLGWTGLLSVPRGGTGLGSATAYAVLCGGTTSTGAFQSVASVGTSGQVLTSNGAGALPTFQTPSSSGTVNSGLQNQLAWYAANGTAVSGLSTANNGVLVTSAGGVPSISSTLPANLAIPTPKITTALLDVNGNTMLTFAPSGGTPVNNFQIANNISTGSPVLSAIGSDSNIGIQIDSKGTAGVYIKGQQTGLTPAGYRGEVISAAVLAASAVAMTNNTARNITSIDVTAGSWVVLGVVSLASGTNNISQAISWCSTTSATLPDNSIRSGQSSAVTSQFNLPTAPLIVNATSTTTVYLSGYAAFGSGSVGGSGYIVAIRI